jgi:hypothetical protein
MLYNIKQLKELSNKPNLTETEERIIVYNYMYWNGRPNIPQIITAKINDKELFQRNLEICKNYFKSFIDE